MNEVSSSLQDDSATIDDHRRRLGAERDAGGRTVEDMSGAERLAHERRSKEGQEQIYDTMDDIGLFGEKELPFGTELTGKEGAKQIVGRDSRIEDFGDKHSAKRAGDV